MMRRVINGIVVALYLAFILAEVVHAVGTATLTGPTVTYTARDGSRIIRYSIAWTSDASGDVSANAFSVIPGRLRSIEFRPGSGGTQPTDLYDVTLVTSGGSVDILAGGGANLSNATATVQQWDPPFTVDGSQTLDLVIANAGNAKTGTVVILAEN